MSYAAPNQEVVDRPCNHKPSNQRARHADPVERLGKRSGHQAWHEHLDGSLGCLHHCDAEALGDQDQTSGCAEPDTLATERNNPKTETADQPEKEAESDSWTVGQIEPGSKGITGDFAQATTRQAMQRSAGREAPGRNVLSERHVMLHVTSVLMELEGLQAAYESRLSCGALKKDSFLNLRARSASSAC